MTDAREIASSMRAEMVGVSRGTISQLELALSRAIERTKVALNARRPEEMARALRPLIASLGRIRAGMHRFTYEPAGIIPTAGHPAQEVARLLAEVGFCSAHLSKCIDRLSQLDEAKGLVSWLNH